MAELLLGLDVGTASSKGVLLRPDGSLGADARADHAMDVRGRAGPSGTATLVWRADVRAITRQLGWGTESRVVPRQET